MITLQCSLEFQNKQDKEIVLDLMRRFSSAMRYAYKRLLEGEKRKAFCCLEKSYRDFSTLKRVIISKDWMVVATRFMTLPKYRLLGLEVSEMAEYKYPNSSCTEQYSFVQFG